MSNALNDEDIDKIITGIRASVSGQSILSGYRFTNTSGKIFFIMSLADVGNLTLFRDENGEYQLQELALEGGEAFEKASMYIGFNALVKKHTGKDWPAKS